MTKRKCYWCKREIGIPLSDFHEVDGQAVSFKGGTAICACPNHQKEMLEYMEKQLLINNQEAAKGVECIGQHRVARQHTPKSGSNPVAPRKSLNKKEGFHRQPYKESWLER